MSYNILAQDLMQQSSELYLHCHPDILNWNYRFANLMQEFQHWDPDVSEERRAGRAVHLAFVLGLGCFPVPLENEFVPTVHMMGVLPGAGACLPEVSEFWPMLRRLSVRALSGTFVQGGRLEGIISVCVWSPRLHSGLLLPGLAGSPVGRFSA